MALLQVKYTDLMVPNLHLPNTYFLFFKMALATAQIDNQDLKELQASLASTIPCSVM